MQMSCVREQWVWLISYRTGIVIARDLEESGIDYCYTSCSMVSACSIFYLKKSQSKICQNIFTKSGLSSEGIIFIVM